VDTDAAKRLALDLTMQAAVSG